MRTSMLRSNRSDVAIVRQVQQSFACQHPVGVAREGGEQIELHCRHRQLRPVRLQQPARLHVQQEIAEAHARLLGVPIAG